MRLFHHPDDREDEYGTAGGSLRRSLAAWAALALTGAGLLVLAAKIAWAIYLNY